MQENTAPLGLIHEAVSPLELNFLVCLILQGGKEGS